MPASTKQGGLQKILLRDGRFTEPAQAAVYAVAIITLGA